MTPDPTNEACERIARECAVVIDGRSTQERADAILTAAARITALKVKATGAEEALASCNCCNDYKALAALRLLERGDQEDKP